MRAFLSHLYRGAYPSASIVPLSSRRSSVSPLDMATVNVFVGQCGNQVGTAFLDTLASEAEVSRDEGYQMQVSARHFRPALRPHVGRSSASTNPVDRSSASSRHTLNSERRVDQQSYYSLSRVAQRADSIAVDVQLPQPRCVLVDMEPKVIDATVLRVNSTSLRADAPTGTGSSNQPFYSLAPQQCVTRGEGSGNNWAFGYFQQGQSRRELIAECLRREAEQHGTVVSTFHLLHSIAGGTGSGVSCLVAEEVKSLFPRSTLLHSVVWPFSCGEVVTQWFNIIMAVSTLRDLADGVCIVYNDRIADELKAVKAHRGLKDAGEVSFPLMNRRISELLTPLHLPQLLYAVPTPHKDTTKNRICGVGSDRHGPADVEVGSVTDGTLPQRYATTADIVEAVALDPVAKFFTGCQAPQLVTDEPTWSAVLGEAARTAQHGFTCAGAFAASGGEDAVNAAAEEQHDASAFYMQHRSCLWAIRGTSARRDGIRALRHILSAHRTSPFPLTSLLVSPVEHWRDQPTLSGAYHRAHLYGPMPIIGHSFATAARKAEELLSVGAFIHHFERYGVSKMELRDAAAVLWETATAYQP